MTLLETPKERVEALTDEQRRHVLEHLIKSIEANGHADKARGILAEWSLIDSGTGCPDCMGGYLCANHVF